MSAWIENKGNNNFELHPLPPVAQWSPVYGILAADFNGDGHTDILLSGNEYNAQPFAGRIDAGNGLLLEGNSKGRFQPLSITESGIYIPGNGRALAGFNYAGQFTIAAVQNQGPLLLFQKKTSRRK